MLFSVSILPLELSKRNVVDAAQITTHKHSTIKKMLAGTVAQSLPFLSSLLLWLSALPISFLETFLSARLTTLDLPLLFQEVRYSVDCCAIERTIEVGQHAPHSDQFVCCNTTSSTQNLITHLHGRHQILK